MNIKVDRMNAPVKCITIESTPTFGRDTFFVKSNWGSIQSAKEMFDKNPNEQVFHFLVQGDNGTHFNEGLTVAQVQEFVDSIQSMIDYIKGGQV